VRIIRLLNRMDFDLGVLSARIVFTDGRRGLSIRRKEIGVANRSLSSGKGRLSLGDYCGPQPLKPAIHSYLRP